MPLTLQEVLRRGEREAHAPPAVMRRRERRDATKVASSSKLTRWTTRRHRTAFALACLAWLATFACFVSSRASASASATSPRSIPRVVRSARGADHRAASTAPRGIPRRARLSPNANPNPNPAHDDDGDENSSDDDIRVIREALRASDEALRAVRDRPRAVRAPSREKSHDATLAFARYEPRPRGSLSSSRAKSETATANDPDPIGAVSLDAASFAASPPPEPWLTVGIPTAPRAGDEDYLTGTLETLLAELPTAPSGVRVLVMNTAPGRHEVFARVKARFTGTWTGTGTETETGSGTSGGNAWGLTQDSGADSGAGEVGAERSAAHSAAAESRLLAAAAAHVVFTDSPGTYGDPTPNKPDPDDLHNPSNVPGHAVRRQTADLATLVDLASRETSPYFLFAEDDFLTCRGMFAGLRYLLAKSHAVYPTWLGVRFSYGMNGVVMRTRDLAPFARYLATHVSRQPPDILWREWSEGRREDARATTAGRRVLVYRYNLMEHVGEVSTFAVRPGRPEWPRCYDPMSEVWSLGAAETFDDARCASQDVSPCLPGYGVHVDRWNGDTPSATDFPWLATRRSSPEA